MRGNTMVNINGKQWHELKSSDIQSVILEQDLDESFYFEFKDDRVAAKKVMEEVSAFANTFGGYIFIGISDDKQIEGCTYWNEQRIHVAMHDSITPTPSFDVKKFMCNTKTIYVIKVDEGTEPPYITSSGKIYERLSSGSFTIKDSVRLSQIYNKREQILAKTERKISIPPIHDDVNNIYGYIDIGFSMQLTDRQIAFDIFRKVDLKSVAKKMENTIHSFNMAHVGNSIVFTPGGLTTSKGQMPAHINNFLEIMADGSARMRILLINNDPNDFTVNMTYAAILIKTYKEVYTCVMGSLFPDKMAYAKKYESLTVLKQFNPTFLYDRAILEEYPDLKEENDRMLTATRKYQKLVGIDIVVTNDRIPKIGLYTIDKRNMEINDMAYTAESIVEQLFVSSFCAIGIIPTLEEEELNT